MKTCMNSTRRRHRALNLSVDDLMLHSLSAMSAPWENNPVLSLAIAFGYDMNWLKIEEDIRKTPIIKQPLAASQPTPSKLRSARLPLDDEAKPTPPKRPLGGVCRNTPAQRSRGVNRFNKPVFDPTSIQLPAPMLLRRSSSRSLHDYFQTTSPDQ